MGKKKGKGRGQARHETAAGEQASTAPTQQQQAAAAPRQQLQQAAGATVGQTSAVQSAPPAKWKPAGQTQEHNLAKHMDTMKIRQDCHGEGGLIPPVKRRTVDGKVATFPGKAGTQCKLVANHFPIALKTIKAIHQYSITIVPPWQRPYSKRDSEIYREIFHKWTTMCPEIRRTMKPNWAQQVNYGFAFNGNNVFYSTQMIDNIRDLGEAIVVAEHPSLKFFVKDVKYTNTIKVTEELNKFFELGRRAYANHLGGPQDLLNALDIILSQAVRLNKMFTSVGRSFFHQEGTILDVGFGKEVWIGTFTSVRPIAWKDGGMLLSLNADVSNKPAVKNLHLTNESGQGGSYIKEVLGPRVDFRRGLSERDALKLEADLKGLKVRYELPNGSKRAYKVNKLVQSARDMKIPDLKISVEEYFKKEHKYSLKYPLMPCLHLGSMQKTIYIPPELCSLEKQPMPRGKKLPDQAVATMIRSTATKPDVRKNKILDGLKRNNQIYSNDPFAQEFGISVQSQMAEINGRVLDPPSIGYKKEQGNEVVPVKINNPGSWVQPARSVYTDGKQLNFWAVLDFCNLDDRSYCNIIDEFVKIGNNVGIRISREPNNLWHERGEEGRLEEHFETIVKEYEKEKMKLDLIMVIFPRKAGEYYDTVKYLGDIRHKIPTQCVLEKTLFKGGRINSQVVSNICLKLNSKLGGTNHVLAPTSRPEAFKVPFMVMGADVSHAPPESKGDKPSIAAIVGSMDPKGSTYECEVRIQKRENNEEIIQDMKEVTKSLLQKFNRKLNRKPSRIIMFRDGVSEGQFLTVLAYELKAMREACFALDPEYKPAITYLVVQKRHHTRLFAADNNKYQRNGNVLAGTVVDQGLNHPTEGDFYLVSHEGIQGTSRPTHYQVLWDDADMTADDLEKLTYYLCHLYSRCTRSVSYPSPTYYSHLAADRARKHHNDMLSKSIPSHEIKRKMEEEEIKIMYFV